MLKDARRNFDLELEEAKKKLAESGRKIRDDQTTDVSGIKSDFEQPYSSLPELTSKKWN